jgi:putative ABC transport system permease protein
MKLAPLGRYARREARGGARVMAFFMACLAVGVAAVVAVDALSAAIDRGVRVQARDLLGADAVVQSWRPLPNSLDDALRGTGVERTDVKEMVTLAATVDGKTPGRTQLVELRVVAPSYPFYGAPRLAPDRPLRDLLTPSTVVIAEEIATHLALRVGDSLRIGGRDFRIAGTVLSEADSLGGSFRLGPRIYLSTAGLARTSLEAFGSHILRRALLRLPPGSGASGADRLAARLKERYKNRDDLRIESYRESQPAVQRTMDRMDPYLALVALVSLLLGGIGVGQGARVWIRGRLDSIAILKALGVRPREILAVYLGQTLLLALAGSALGVAVGLAVPWLVPRLVGSLLPEGLLRASWMGPGLHGLAIGVMVALVFSAWPLLAVLRVPPSRVFRRDAEPLPWPRVWSATGAVVVLTLLASVAAFESRSWVHGAVFVGGLAGVLLMLGLAARGVARVAAWLGRRVGGIPLRYGAAGLARPGFDTLGAVTALGLGLSVVVALATVQSQLTREFQGDLPKDAPTTFFIDIQPDQWAAVRRILVDGGATRIDAVPVIMARLRAIDGRSAVDIARGMAPDRRWALTREQRLTYLEDLPKGNTVVEGSWWRSTARNDVSLEVEFAHRLGATVGSRLTFDVQGVPITLTVTSLRRVNWRTFGINFFAVANPAALSDAPQTLLAAARLPQQQEQRIQDRLVAAVPNVTVIRIRDMLEKVSGVVERLADGVRFLGGFTFVAGLGILAAAFHIAGQGRRREVALLKVLGFTRAQVLVAFAVQYALIGLTAAAIGTIAGCLLGWLVVRWILDLSWHWPFLPLLLAAASTTLVALLTSLAATRPAIRTRPSRVL